MGYLFDTNIVIYYFNGLTADEALHHAGIAATALVHDLTVVTLNTGDSEHFGLETLAATMEP